MTQPPPTQSGSTTMQSMRLLRAIADGYRNDWSDFDGRSAKHELYAVAALAERETAGEDVTAEVEQLLELERELRR